MTARKSVWAGVRGVNGRMAEIFTRASLKQQTSSYRYRNEWKPMAALHQQWCKVYMISHGPVWAVCWNSCTLFSLFTWSPESRGIRQMMQLPCYCSNSPAGTTSPPPQGFTLLIDWLTPFPFQESLSRLINTAHFPKDTAYSHIHDPEILAYIPTVQCWISAITQPAASKGRKQRKYTEYSKGDWNN